jgi:ABC-type sugar transport system substrate-binding protein
MSLPRDGRPAMLNLRIALFLRAAGNEYQDLVREDCRTAALRHGLAVREINAENDSTRQFKQIEDCLAEPASSRPRAILVSPVDESGLRSLAREAARMGIGWVSLNRACDYLAELRREFPSVPLFSVHPDQDQVGRIQAYQLRVLLPAGGHAAYIQGPPSTTSARQRAAALRSGLAGTDIELTPFSSDWSVEGGRRAAQEWLELAGRSTSENRAVVAQNDSMGYGARLALIEAARQAPGPGLDRIPVLGCDGAPAYGHKLVIDRSLSATVIIPSPASRALDELVAVLAGWRPPASDICLSVSPFPELAVLAGSQRKGS